MEIVKLSDVRTEVRVDEYVDIALVLERDGFYCIMRPKREDSFGIAELKGYRVLFKINKGLLKDTIVEIVDSYLDITQIFKYDGNGSYVSELLGLKATIHNDTNFLSVTEIAKDSIKPSSVFNK